MSNSEGQISIGVQADVVADVTIGEVFSGYFNSDESARAFNEIGVSQAVPRLSPEISMADFGGGDGFLAANVRGYLSGRGILARTTVVDMNPTSLARAESQGLQVLQSSLETVQTEPLDLAIARAVLHYNPLESQKNIVAQIARCLKPEGSFVHSISSGDPANCALRGYIAALPALGRVGNGMMHFATTEEYLSMAKEAGFTSTTLVGYAPENSWTLTEMFERFNPDPDGTSERRTHFMANAMGLIKRYVDETDIRGISLCADDAQVTYQYPIFASH